MGDFPQKVGMASHKAVSFSTKALLNGHFPPQLRLVAILLRRRVVVLRKAFGLPLTWTNIRLRVGVWP